MIVVVPMVPIIAIIPVLPIISMCRDIPIYRNIPMFAIPVVPAMFRAVVGVFTAVIYVISSKHAPWMLRDLVSDSRMFSQEISYFFMLIEILAVVN